MGLHPAFDVILAFAGSNDRFCQTFELIFVVFFRPLRKHGSVTNVDHSYRFIRDYEQNSIGSAIAGAKQHLTIGTSKWVLSGARGQRSGKWESVLILARVLTLHRVAARGARSRM
jgi:hypothetical protein